MFPGEADAIEFGWYCYWDETRGWVQCDKDHPRARPNLNRLFDGEAMWDADAGRWMLRKTLACTLMPGEANANRNTAELGACIKKAVGNGGGQIELLLDGQGQHYLADP